MIADKLFTVNQPVTPAQPVNPSPTNGAANCIRIAGMLQYVEETCVESEIGVPGDRDHIEQRVFHPIAPIRQCLHTI